MIKNKNSTENKDLIMNVDNILQLQDQFLYDLQHFEPGEKDTNLNVGLFIEMYYWLVVEIENKKYGYENMEDELDLSILKKNIIKLSEG